MDEYEGIEKVVDRSRADARRSHGKGGWTGIADCALKTLTFINQDKTEIVPRRVLLVHVPERGGKVESAQE